MEKAEDEQFFKEEEEAKPEDQSSALQASIGKKGQYSYYYAHKKKPEDEKEGQVFVGNGIVTGGDPVLLKKQESLKEPEKPKQLAITKYLWMDDGDKVKIYIDLKEPVYEGVLQSSVEVNFQEQALTVEMVDGKGNMHRLQLPNLHDKIEPEKSKWNIRNEKVTIRMHKWIDTKWRELTSKPAAKS